VGGVIVTASAVLVAKVPTGAMAPRGDHKWLVVGIVGIIVGVAIAIFFGIVALHEWRTERRERAPNLVFGGTNQGSGEMQDTHKSETVAQVAIANERGKGAVSALHVYATIMVTDLDGTVIVPRKDAGWSNNPALELDEIPPNGHQVWIDTVLKIHGEDRWWLWSHEHEGHPEIPGRALLVKIEVHGTNFDPIAKWFHISHEGVGSPPAIEEAQDPSKDAPTFERHDDVIQSGQSKVTKWVETRRGTDYEVTPGVARASASAYPPTVQITEPTHEDVLGEIARFRTDRPPPGLPVKPRPDFSPELRRFKTIDDDYEDTAEWNRAIDQWVEDVHRKLGAWNGRNAERFMAARLIDSLGGMSVNLVRTDLNRYPKLNELHMRRDRLREITDQ